MNSFDPIALLAYLASVELRAEFAAQLRDLVIARWPATKRQAARDALLRQAAGRLGTVNARAARLHRALLRACRRPHEASIHTMAIALNEGRVPAVRTLRTIVGRPGLESANAVGAPWLPMPSEPKPTATPPVTLSALLAELNRSPMVRLCKQLEATFAPFTRLRELTRRIERLGDATTQRLGPPLKRPDQEPVARRPTTRRRAAPKTPKAPRRRSRTK